MNVNKGVIPWVTYTEPELAQAGLTEAQARARRFKIRILRWPYHDNDRAQTERETHGHIKVVTDRKGRILGATIVGAQAGELIATWVLAIAQGLNIKAMTGDRIALSDLVGNRQTRGHRLFYAQFDEPNAAAHHSLGCEFSVEAALQRDHEPAARDHHARAGGPRAGPRVGLSGKLLLLTVLFVMVAEILIYVPSVANFRLNWLNDRLAAAHTAALVLEAAPSGMVPESLAKQILQKHRRPRAWRSRWATSAACSPPPTCRRRSRRTSTCAA